MHTTKQRLAKRLVKMSLMQNRKRSLSFKTREKLVDPIEEEIKKILLKEKSRQGELLEGLKSGCVPSFAFEFPLVMFHRAPDCHCDEEVPDSEEESVEGFDELDKKDETAIHESRGDDGDYNEIVFTVVQLEYDTRPGKRVVQESVEGFDELDKKDETAIHESRGDDGDYNEIVIFSFEALQYSPAGSTDDEEAEALDQMKAGKKRILASKGLEKDTLESNSKKKVEREDADES